MCWKDCLPEGGQWQGDIYVLSKAYPPIFWDEEKLQIGHCLLPYDSIQGAWRKGRRHLVVQLSHRRIKLYLSSRACEKVLEFLRRLSLTCPPQDFGSFPLQKRPSLKQVQTRLSLLRYSVYALQGGLYLLALFLVLHTPWWGVGLGSGLFLLALFWQRSRRPQKVRRLEAGWEKTYLWPLVEIWDGEKYYSPLLLKRLDERTLAPLGNFFYELSLWQKWRSRLYALSLAVWGLAFPLAPWTALLVLLLAFLWLFPLERALFRRLELYIFDEALWQSKRAVGAQHCLRAWLVWGVWQSVHRQLELFGEILVDLRPSLSRYWQKCLKDALYHFSFSLPKLERFLCSRLVPYFSPAEAQQWVRLIFSPLRPLEERVLSPFLVSPSPPLEVLPRLLAAISAETFPPEAALAYEAVLRLREEAPELQLVAQRCAVENTFAG